MFDLIMIAVLNTAKIQCQSIAEYRWETIYIVDTAVNKYQQCYDKDGYSAYYSEAPTEAIGAYYPSAWKPH